MGTLRTTTTTITTKIYKTRSKTIKYNTKLHVFPPLCTEGYGIYLLLLNWKTTFQLMIYWTLASIRNKNCENNVHERSILSNERTFVNKMAGMCKSGYTTIDLTVYASFNECHSTPPEKDQISLNYTFVIYATSMRKPGIYRSLLRKRDKYENSRE